MKLCSVSVHACLCVCVFCFVVSWSEARAPTSGSPAPSHWRPARPAGDSSHCSSRRASRRGARQSSSGAASTNPEEVRGHRYDDWISNHCGDWRHVIMARQLPDVLIFLLMCINSTFCSILLLLPVFFVCLFLLSLNFITMIQFQIIATRVND